MGHGSGVCACALCSEMFSDGDSDSSLSTAAGNGLLALSWVKSAPELLSAESKESSGHWEKIDKDVLDLI